MLTFRCFAYNFGKYIREVSIIFRYFAREEVGGGEASIYILSLGNEDILNIIGKRNVNKNILSDFLQII